MRNAEERTGNVIWREDEVAPAGEDDEVQPAGGEDDEVQPTGGEDDEVQPLLLQFALYYFNSHCAISRSWYGTADWRHP